MNLITSAWIPVIYQDGATEFIAPWQIAETDNPVIEINAPRADFQGALYQFFIALLQTSFAPGDEHDWLEYWEEAPSVDKLKESFEKLGFAFELDNSEGVAFLQDYDLPEGESKQISALLIEAPGGNALKNNSDHFVKRGQANQLCPSCAATALFTLQANAPAGGVGHRVSLRGGGPLTTLVLPENKNATLWQKIWLNVLNQEEMESAETIDADILPWLGKTRLSDKSGEWLDNGNYQLSIPFSDSRELIMDILKHGAEVKVKEPSFLLDLVKKEIQKMKKNYHNLTE